MRYFAIVFSVAVLLGSVIPGHASIDQKLHAPKIPKRVDQSPEAPKLVARDNYYSPRYLRVAVVAGNEISLENKGFNIHGFIIPAFSYQGVIKPGQIEKIPVPRAAKVGLYDFFCPFHPGMRGTIQVLPSDAG